MIADTPTANEMLMGLEAKTRNNFAELLVKWTHADRLPEFETVASLEAGPITVLVTYHPLRNWEYFFTTGDALLRGMFDCRDSVVEALAKHLEAPAPVVFDSDPAANNHPASWGAL